MAVSAGVVGNKLLVVVNGGPQRSIPFADGGGGDRDSRRGHHRLGFGGGDKFWEVYY